MGDVFRFGQTLWPRWPCHIHRFTEFFPQALTKFCCLWFQSVATESCARVKRKNLEHSGLLLESRAEGPNQLISKYPLNNSFQASQIHTYVMFLNATSSMNMFLGEFQFMQIKKKIPQPFFKSTIQNLLNQATLDTPQLLQIAPGPQPPRKLLESALEDWSDWSVFFELWLLWPVQRAWANRVLEQNVTYCSFVGKIPHWAPKNSNLIDVLDAGRNAHYF